MLVCTKVVAVLPSTALIDDACPFSFVLFPFRHYLAFVRSRQKCGRRSAGHSELFSARLTPDSSFATVESFRVPIVREGLFWCGLPSLGCPFAGMPSTSHTGSITVPDNRSFDATSRKGHEKTGQWGW